MALLDVLRDRAARKGGTAQVVCGELGQLTVEALSLAECTRLAQTPRALFYAACRELQLAGETLRQEGALFAPDEIMQSITEEEVLIAAETILSLSGATISAKQENPDNKNNDDPDAVSDPLPHDLPPQADAIPAAPATPFSASSEPASSSVGKASVTAPQPLSEQVLSSQETTPTVPLPGALSPSPEELPGRAASIAGGSSLQRAAEKASSALPITREATHSGSAQRKALTLDASSQERSAAEPPADEVPFLPTDTPCAVPSRLSLRERRELAEDAANILARELRRTAMVR